MLIKTRLVCVNVLLFRQFMSPTASLLCPRNNTYTVTMDQEPSASSAPATRLLVIEVAHWPRCWGICLTQQHVVLQAHIQW